MEAKRGIREDRVPRFWFDAFHTHLGLSHRKPTGSAVVDARSNREGWQSG